MIDEKISTHTPHAGRDQFAGKAGNLLILFLLTRPMRGATNDAEIMTPGKNDFYSHAPCGARPV